MMTKIVLLRLIESYFRHRWLNLLPIVIATVIGVVFIQQSDPTYTSSGVVYVDDQSYLATLSNVSQSSDSWWLSPSQAVSQEINELLRTDAFIRAIIQDTGLEENMDGGREAIEETIDQTRNALWSTSIGENQIQMNATFDDPQIAYQLVSSAIAVYLQWQINAEISETEVAQVFFSDLILEYEANLAEARSEMREYFITHPEPIRGVRPGEEQLEISRLQADVDLAASRLATALNQEENARLTMAQIESDARQTFFLIDAPQIPEQSNTSLRNLAMNFAIFVAAGVILSATLIVGTAIIDRTIRFPIDAQQIFDLPVLTLVYESDITDEKIGFTDIADPNTQTTNEEEKGEQSLHPEDISEPIKTNKTSLKI
jgi:uncharacterized protein involved in exopolysaccharide biosynthesis